MTSKRCSASGTSVAELRSGLVLPAPGEPERAVLPVVCHQHAARGDRDGAEAGQQGAGRPVVAALSADPEAPEPAVVVKGLSDEQLDTPYRDGGWTVRQLAHHVPDSHMNAYIRTKLALTEDDPVIRPYDEQRWAMLPDSERTPIETSLDLLDAVHARWVTLLRATAPEDFERPLRHPESGPLTIGLLILQYGWHGDHHVAHITRLREREGW